MSLNKALVPGLSGLSGTNPAGGTGGGGPGFSWGDYAGLQIRFDFSDARYMTISNTLVSSATDLTGNGLNAVQANASLQPTTSVITGALTGVQGNAVAFLATEATLSDNATKTVFAVVKAPEGNTVRHFSGAAQSRLGVTAADARFIRAGTQLTGTAYTANTLEIWLAEFNGASSNLYVNGGAANASGNAGTSLDTSVTILSLAAGTQATDGVVGEYSRFNRALSTTEKNEIGGFLGTKWGITWNTIS